MTHDEIVRKKQEYLFNCVTTYFKDPMVIDHAKGQYVWDAEGKQFLDFLGGIVTVSVGHANPKVTDKIKAQIDKVQHTSTLFITEALVNLAEKVASIAPGKLKNEIDRVGADPVDYVRNMLAAKQKISGFGHRVYKTEDPRATHLRKMSEQLGKDAGVPKWFDYSRAIELYINADKKLNANVDFYSASTYATLGIDIDLYTPIFAISRIAGWAAHIIEQLDDNRLIRPRAEYIGPPYPAPYIPMEDRG